MSKDEFTKDPTGIEYPDWVPQRFRYLINDPAARYNLRVAFYKKYGDDPKGKSLCKRIIRWITHKDGFGISELDFMQWEINRKVLNPINGMDGSGSAWWRNMNLNLLIKAQIAAEIIEGKHHNGFKTDNEIDCWLEYIRNPHDRTWYKAHNASIVRGYLDFTNDAMKESIYEQTFMNEVLYRLLFAQALVEDDTAFKKDGEFAANPMLPAVDLMVKIPAFYPDHYPLSIDDIKDVMHKGHSLEGDIERDFDEYLIGPHIIKLYELATNWVNIPQLQFLQVNGKPVYPNLQTNNTTSV